MGVCGGGVVSDDTCEQRARSLVRMVPTNGWPGGGSLFRLIAITNRMFEFLREFCEVLVFGLLESCFAIPQYIHRNSCRENTIVLVPSIL